MFRLASIVRIVQVTIKEMEVNHGTVDYQAHPYIMLRELILAALSKMKYYYETRACLGGFGQPVTAIAVYTRKTDLAFPDNQVSRTYARNILGEAHVLELEKRALAWAGKIFKEGGA